MYEYTSINNKATHSYLHLYSAIKSNNKKKVLEHIDNGANINEKDSNGWTPLHWAAKLDMTEIALELINRGADINARASGGTPLHIATKLGRAKTVLAIIDKGADINARDEYGSTPLHSAIQRKKVENMLALIYKGADINARDNYGNTPLHTAVSNGNNKSIIILNCNGSDKNAMSNSKEKPIDIINWEIFISSKRYNIIKNILQKSPEDLIAPYLSILIENNCYAMLLHELQRTPLKQEHLVACSDIDNKTMNFIKKKHDEATGDAPLENHRKELAKAICGHPNQSPNTDTKVKIGLFSLRYNLRDLYLKAYSLFFSIQKYTENKIIQNILEYSGIIPMGIEHFDIKPTPAMKIRIENKQSQNITQNKHESYENRYTI
jgi:ankyrin repeat protein